MAFHLIDPRGETDRSRRATVTPRPGAVPDPLSIGFLVNEVSRQTGPDFWGYSLVIEDLLRERYPQVEVVRDAKPVLSRPADRALLDRYRQCRGVVTGLAK